MKTRSLILMVFIALGLAVTACSGAATTPATTPATSATVVMQTVVVVATPVPAPATPVIAPTALPTPAALTPAALRNAEYQVSFTASGKAKLIEGEYSEPAAPGSASKVTVKLSDFVVFADLNGDGLSDAVVILVTNSGGSGVFYELAAVLNQGGAPKHVGSLALGDRVKIKTINLQSGEVVLEMTVHGPKDPQCCPTVDTTKRYKFADGKLVSATPETPVPTVAANVTRPVTTAVARATATATRPPAPKGYIAYQFNDNGIDRANLYDLASKTSLPFRSIGPVLDITQNTDASMIAWSPDNSKIAYIDTGGPDSIQVLRLYNAALNTHTGLHSSEGIGGLSSPVWSPDGKQIAFVRLSSNQRDWSVLIINADGTPCTTDSKQWCTVRLAASGEQFNGGLAWSKQGIFAVGAMSAPASGSNIYTFNLDGTGWKNVTNNAAENKAPAFSPDGKQIAFESTRDGRKQIYIVNTDGTGSRRVSQSTVPDFSPTWSPDGNWLGFASTRNNSTNIFMMDLRGNNVTQVTPNTAYHPSWSH
jgi:hypothetical protein